MQRLAHDSGQAQGINSIRCHVALRFNLSLPISGDRRDEYEPTVSQRLQLPIYMSWHFLVVEASFRFPDSLTLQREISDDWRLRASEDMSSKVRLAAQKLPSPRKTTERGRDREENLASHR